MNGDDVQDGPWLVVFADDNLPSVWCPRRGLADAIVRDVARWTPARVTAIVTYDEWEHGELIDADPQPATGPDRHPQCARCGRQIQPGTAVEFVGPDADKIDTGEQRIFVEDEILVVHASCPPDPAVN